MNARERFLRAMRFEPGVVPPKWEFGYWGATLDNWYAEGLPKRQYPRIENAISTPTSSLYTRAWGALAPAPLPKGLPVMGGGLYWPTQGFPLDYDVRRQFGLDMTQRLADVNLLFCPMFEPNVLREDEAQLDYIDLDGVRRILLKETATMPSGTDWPVKDRHSWEQLKAERLRLDNLRDRFPPNWHGLVREYRSRDYPLALGGYPHGMFGTLAHLMGYETLFTAYFETPDLVRDIVSTFTTLWIAVYEEVLKDVQADHVQIWEDISYGSGSMVSPAVIREFMLPCYKRFTDFLRSKGVTIILLDTDGDCFDLIPLFIEGGITGMYPFEAHCGMDIAKVRRAFPKLQMLGGIPKSEIALGKAKIDEILEPVRAVLRTGGYIPFGDHFIPPEVSWPTFTYYRNELNRIMERSGTNR